MGELIIRLTDVISCKNKQKFKRTPFSDRSNFQNMSMKSVQLLTNKRTSRRMRKPKSNCSCCHKISNTEECLKSTHCNDLRVVIERCNSNHSCNANVNQTPSGFDEDNVKSVKNVQNEKINGVKELQINITPLTVAKANIMNEDSSKSIFYNTKDNFQYTNATLIQHNATLNNPSINKCNKMNSIDQVESSKTYIKQKIHNNGKYLHGNINGHNNVKDNMASNTPIFKRLRPCIKKNYLEISECSTHEKNVSSDKGQQNKVPIYNQVVIKENTDKKDPYELDLSDLDEKTSKKVKHRNPSEKFDKTMHEIIKKLEKKHHKKPRKKKVVFAPHKYEDNIKSVLQRVMKKVSKKKGENTNNKPLAMEKVHIERTITGHAHIKTQNRPNVTSQNYNTNCQNNIRLPKTSVVPQIGKSNENINGLNDTYYIDEEIGYPRPSSSLSTASTIESLRVRSPSPFYIENGKYFGFDDDDDQLSPQLTNSRINIISDVTLNPLCHGRRNPVAHSTMILHPQKSPWRLNGKRKSNYVVQYKENALPCLKQDAVVDYTLVEKIEDSFSKTKTSFQTPQKSHIQTSILDYVDSSQNPNSVTDQENITTNVNHRSLYDYEEFECKQSKRAPNKNRTILGVIHENNLNKEVFNSTPCKQNRIGAVPTLDLSVIGKTTNISSNHESDKLQKNTLENDNESFFGFSSLDSIDCELKNCPSKGKPFRLSIGTVKSYKKKINDENSVDLMWYAADLPSVLNNEPENQTNEDVGIFNDVEPEFLVTADAPIQYGRKGKRRQRLASVTSDCSDEDKPKKRKKNAMTKTEEEEFEKWAAQFNAMCSQIEKHDLEIE